MGERLEIRVDAAEKVAYDQAAAAAGVDRSDWIRAVLNKAAGKVRRKGGPAGS